MKASTAPAAVQPLKVVLDTNVVLDWLVFDRPDTKELQQAAEERRIIVLSSASALDELQRVLADPQLGLDVSRQRQILALYRAHTAIGVVPDGFSRRNVMLPSGFPRCSDRSDEHFIALAYHTRADALVSKDKAVLKMGKRVKKFGVKIIDVRQLTDTGSLK